MKKINTLMLLPLCLLLAGRAMAEDKIEPQIYAFGFSASFNDSTVYFTDIQTIDSVWVDSKTGFILERGMYANQMRNYFTQSGQPNRTCVFFYDVKFKNIAKKFRKMKERYVAGNNFDIRYLKPDEFVFERNPIDGLEEYLAQRDKAKKEKKKKKSSGDDRPGPPDGRGGGPGGGMPPGGSGGMPPGGGR